jgi:hypothetical protein
MRDVFPQSDGLNDAIASDWLVGGGPFLDVSAYARGCSTLPDSLQLYLIFNDTLFTKHSWRLISRRLSRVRDSLSEFPTPAAAGEVHPSTDLLFADSHNSGRRHISTFCLLLNNGGFHLFRRLLSELPTSADAEVVQAWIEDRVAEYPALRALLHVHLFGPRTPWSWRQSHSSLISRKAVTVIFEYMFTVKLLSCGAGIPINHGLAYRFRSKLGHYG